jgi:hypothetical protein
VQHQQQAAGNDTNDRSGSWEHGMTKWLIEDGVLLFCKGEHIKDIPEGLPSDLHLNTPFLYEWIEYWLEAPAALDVCFGAEMAHPVRSGLFRYTYCNQIGQSTIRLRMTDGRMIRKDVEVIFEAKPMASQGLAAIRSSCCRRMN